jgi:hypothetical protein
VKHIKENCNTCGVELTDTNWNSSWKKTNRTQCQDCNNPNRTKHNPDRMYVNGKYVPKKHPLYKAGRYKTFEGAAFSALEGYNKSTDGHVYIISNPCWDGWFKVGMAVDPEDRCNSYQTSSPFRDYKLCYNKYFKDRRSAEQTAHKKLKKSSLKYKGEWFKVSIKEAIKTIEKL